MSLSLYIAIHLLLTSTGHCICADVDDDDDDITMTTRKKIFASVIVRYRLTLKVGRVKDLCNHDSEIYAGTQSWQEHWGSRNNDYGHRGSAYGQSQRH